MTLEVQRGLVCMSVPQRVCRASKSRKEPWYRLRADGASEFCREVEEKGFRFSLVDAGKPLHGQADGRFWLDWELRANWIRRERARCCQVTVTLE